MHHRLWIAGGGKPEGIGHDVELCGFGGSKSVAPGLYDAAPSGFDGEIGLELADGAFAEHAGVEDQSLGSSVSSTRHARNISPLSRSRRLSKRV
jgi:hypothetical protein